MSSEVDQYFQFQDETISEIEEYSATGYSVTEIAVILGLSERWLLDMYETEGSQFRIAYDSGNLKHKAKRDIELNRSASNGSITAIQILEKMLEKRRIEEFKYKLLNGLA